MSFIKRQHINVDTIDNSKIYQAGRDIYVKNYIRILKDRKPRKNSEDIRNEIISNSRLNYKKFHSVGMPFHDLIINEDIMPGLQIKRDEIIETEIKVNDEVKVTLIEGIKKLWEKDIFHTSVIGEGGMGKTVSLLKLWNIFLECNSLPIPIYIELNNYNTYYVKSENESLHNRNYIMNVIIRNYLGVEKIADEDRNALSEMLRVKKSVEGKNIPSIILLLDGLNEVTVTNRDLIYEINEFIKNYSGVQLIITSRYELKNMSQYMGCFNKIELLKLTDGQILSYLNKGELEKPVNKIFDLLKNPMMLTIYSITCHMLKINRSIRLNLKDEVETYGELMWNYKEAQLMKSADIEEQFIKYSFILNHVIPYLGFKMESMGKFELTKKELKNFINEICEKLYCIEFTEAYDMYAGDLIKKLKLGKLDWPDDDDRFNKYMDVNKTLHIIYYTDENKNSIKFSHQNFRDFFAACHVLNEMKINIAKNKGLNEKEIPQILKEKPLSVYVRRCIGEIEEEHHNKPIIDRKTKKWLINNRYTSTIVTETLNNCRHTFDGRIGYAVWNLIEILKSARMDFTGMDFSYLDLRKCLLNGVRFSRRYGDEKTNTKFDGSLIDMKIFMNQGHTLNVNSATYSPDGRYILSASEDGTIKEWDRETDDCIRTYEVYEGRVEYAVYSPDGKYILSSEDGTIKEWDRETGECIRTYEVNEIGIRSIAYSPDGKYILLASGYTFKEWDRETGKYIGIYKSHEYSVNSVVYSPDGKYILLASVNGTIKEWDRETHKCIKIYEDHEYPESSVEYVAYSPDGKYILSAPRNHGDRENTNTFKEWNAKTGECIRTYEGHEAHATHLVYSPDGKYILSALDDGTIREWDREICECIRTYKVYIREVKSLVYSPDGKYILSALDDGTIREWDRETGECIRTYKVNETRIRSIAYSPDGKYILSGSKDRSIKEWNRETCKCIRTYEGHDIESVAYSSDSKYILSSDYSTINEWDRETGECIRTYENHESSVEYAAYSPDGKYILSFSQDGIIKEWDRETYECIRTYEDRGSDLYAVVYSSDGKYILSFSDNTLKEWDRETGECIIIYEDSIPVYSSDCKYKLSASGNTIEERDRETYECIRTYQGHESSVQCAVYSSDGKYIVSLSDDGTIKAWDRETGECIRKYELYEGIATSKVYGPDAKYVLSNLDDSTIREWDRETGECIRTYENHKTYSSDGKYRLLVSNVGIIKEWDRETDDCIRTYEGYGSSIEYAAYSPDGKYILSVSLYGVIAEWDRETGECIRICENRERDLYAKAYSSDGKYILSVSNVGIIKEWDRETDDCIRTYEDYGGSVEDAVYSPDSKYILSVSRDGIIKERDRETGECIRIYRGHEGRVECVVYSSDGKCILSASYDRTIKEWDIETCKCIRTIKYISGLLIQDCTFKNLNPKSNLTDKEKEVLRQYGAVF